MNLPLDRLSHVTGFGMITGADGYLYRPTQIEEFHQILNLAKQSGRQITLRGSGRSYGDANIGSESILVDITNFISIDLGRPLHVYDRAKLNGALVARKAVDGENINFENGRGYIEKDWGTSFPKKYCWIQCNNFASSEDSLFFSIAHIPFLGFEFMGFIGILKV